MRTPASSEGKLMTCIDRPTRARLAALGLRTVDLPALRDVDDIAAARAVAAAAPASRFAAALAGIEPEAVAA